MLSNPNAGYFLQLLGALADALAFDGHPIHNPLVLKQFEATLINALIYGQPNTLQNPLSAPEPARRISPFLSNAEEFILAHAHEPLSIEQLAEHAGVSVRTLFSGFREFRNTSPMAFLRHVRMERVHLELRNPGTDSVTDIAMKWGVAHLGRFSQEYRKHYGELPSATLRFAAEDSWGYRSSRFSAGMRFWTLCVRSLNVVPTHLPTILLGSADIRIGKHHGHLSQPSRAVAYRYFRGQYACRADV
ncbi:HTH-type transcriptional activator RhaS [Pseudomonas syringae pv. actinidiae]|nr:HTH-type transcriptional activator RhaS [Pseudomonas syringae pv. actinidiae]